MRLRMLAAAVALSVAVVPVWDPPADADNTAVAVNTKDGFDVFRLAFLIKRATGDVVDASNAAVAFASCTDCQTVAIAIEIVLIFSDPSVFTPENLALAYNLNCTLCETLASAYQLLFTTGGPVTLTADGNRRMAELRRRLVALRNAELSVTEIQAQVDAIVAEMLEILSTELVPAGPEAGTANIPSSPSPSPSASVSPSPSPSDTPSASSSAEPSPSPSESPSP